MAQDYGEMNAVVGMIVRAEQQAHKQARMLHDLDVEFREMADRVESGTGDRILPNGETVTTWIARSESSVVDLAERVRKFHPVGEVVVDYVERQRRARLAE